MYSELHLFFKLKERLQKPGETITAFITDWMLLIDRQVRDQFVYGIADDELKKILLEKGNTLTPIDASTAVSKEEPKKVLLCN